MSEQDKNITPDNGIPEPPESVPGPVPNIQAKNSKVSIPELDAIGKKEDWEKRWKVETGGSGHQWQVSKTYNTYKDLLLEYLQKAVNVKTTVGLKRKAAKKFLQYSDRVANQFEAINKKKPLDGVSVRVAAAKKNLEIAKTTMSNIESDIKTFEEQIKLCEKYASETKIEELSKNPSIARPKSLGRGWLPENHLNDTLEQIEKGKGSGVGGTTKNQYKIDILAAVGINPDSAVDLFNGFDKRVITLGGLSSFFTERGNQLESMKSQAEAALKEAEINKAYKEKELFEAEEDIKLAKKQMSGDYNNRVRKAFRLGNEVLNGNLFNLLISDDWTPLDGQESSSYSKNKSVSLLSKVFDSALGKVKELFEKTKEDVQKDSKEGKELEESIAEGKEDVEDWKHLSKLWPGYVALDKLMTSNYVVALMAQGSRDDQTFHIKKIDKSLNPEKIIPIFLDARAGNSSELKELEGSKAIADYLVSHGLSPRNGPFLLETHKETGKPVLSQTAIDIGKLSKTTKTAMNAKLGLNSNEEENKKAKSKK